MGYTDMCVSSLKQAIRDLTIDETYEAKDKLGFIRTHERRTVAKCFKGNPRFKGTLWVVVDRCIDGVCLDRFICCYLLDCKRGSDGENSWGYRGYTEECHPYVYSCPVSYLDMTPEACPEWRSKVREYASIKRAHRKAQNAARKLLKEQARKRELAYAQSRALSNACGPAWSFSGTCEE